MLSSRVSYDGGKKDNLDVPIVRSDVSSTPKLETLNPKQHDATPPLSGAWPDASSDLASLPLFDIFLPSLALSITASSPVKYVLYFGYDAGDQVFDNQTARQQMDGMMGKLMLGLPVEWRWFKCVSARN